MAITLDGSNGISSPDFEPSSSTVPTNGLFLPTTNTIAWATNSTERLRLDASGNLGLGVTPSAWGSSWKAFQVGNSHIVQVDTQFNVGYNNYYDGTNFKYINTDYASIFLQSVGAFKWLTAPSGTAGNAISFTQAMTLDASGNLLVGTTSLSAVGSRISVKGSSVVWGLGPTSGNDSFFVYNASSVGVYLGNGATSWSSSSDERLKTDLKPIESAAQKVSTLRAVTGRFKTDDEGVRRAFLIAQDVQAVLPEAVDASDPDKLGVQYTDTIPLLVAAIKELTQRLEKLENQNGK